MTSYRKLTSDDVVVVVVTVTLTLLTSRLADAVDALRRDQHGVQDGGRAVVTWFDDDVAVYRRNSVLQRDEPTKTEEVGYCGHWSLLGCIEYTVYSFKNKSKVLNFKHENRTTTKTMVSVTVNMSPDITFAR